MNKLTHRELLGMAAVCLRGCPAEHLAWEAADQAGDGPLEGLSRMLALSAINRTSPTTDTAVRAIHLLDLAIDAYSEDARRELATELGIDPESLPDMPDVARVDHA